ncbi:MAG: class I SAM-dependent methyltransferase [Bacteroidales bacterium]|nr:class I SAM-dependent methyltransferase [Bacteroidales bacterium]
MQYDPIKRSLGKVFNTTPFLRVVFYKLLDMLLLRSWHIKREIRDIQSSIPAGAEILDAGSGFGQYSHFLAKKFPQSKITGVDVKEEQIADCNAYFTKLGLSDSVTFRIADLTRFREENKYSLVLSVDVMEHILEDVVVFKNFVFSMKKGGILLISTPSDQGGSDVHDDDDESFIEEHVRDGYNIAEIEDKLRSAGFSEVYAQYSYGKPGGLSWRLSMKYPITLLNTSKLFFILLPFYYILTYPLCLVLNFMDVRMKHRSGTGLIVRAVR